MSIVLFILVSVNVYVYSGHTNSVYVSLTFKIFNVDDSIVEGCMDTRRWYSSKESFVFSTSATWKLKLLGNTGLRY